MIIGTIRFLHLSPREGGTIERHFGLSARRFSLAPAGYYRQQGTKTGRKPKRDGTNSEREPTGARNPSPPGTLRQRGTIRSNRCSIEASQDRGGITLHRSDQARGTKFGNGPVTNFSNRNHRQGEPSAIGTIGNRNHWQLGEPSAKGNQNTNRLFPQPIGILDYIKAGDRDHA